MARVTDELDAVVDGTECATQQILTAAEFIESAAATLGLAPSASRIVCSPAMSVRQVVRILEACNFQDVTGSASPRWWRRSNSSRTTSAG